MIGLLQRVTSAQVVVMGETVGAIDRGLLVLIGVERGDTRTQADRLMERLLSYRIFPDQLGRMNLSVRGIQGGLLLVPQFTLAADTRKGTRPSFTGAADPGNATELFHYFVESMKKTYPRTEQGQFGADMQVTLTNDGPVTFWLQVAPTQSE